jgi:hypothetical protein
MNIGKLSAKVVRGKIAGRLCAVCQKRTGEDTYGFHGILSANGIAGDKAHPRRVKGLKNAKMKRERLAVSNGERGTAT